MARLPQGQFLPAVAGGAVDAIVIMGFRVLTAAQTGNTILLAVAVARGDLAAGWSAALSLAGFVSGAVLGWWLAGRPGLPPSFTLFLEATILSGMLVLWLRAGPEPTAAIGNTIITGVAAAMGIQSAAVLSRKVGPPTYVTGVLESFAHGLVSGRTGGGSVGSPPRLHGLAWLAYFSGAVGAGWAFRAAGPAALAIPIGCLVVAACATSRRRPESHGPNPSGEA